jgi:hypothetical protein
MTLDYEGNLVVQSAQPLPPPSPISLPPSTQRPGIYSEQALGKLGSGRYLGTGLGRSGSDPANAAGHSQGPNLGTALPGRSSPPSGRPYRTGTKWLASSHPSLDPASSQPGPVVCPHWSGVPRRYSSPSTVNH